MKPFILFLAIISGSLLALPLTSEEKRSEIRELSTLIKSQYGPYEYKVKALKMDVDALVTRYSTTAETSSNLEFFYLLNRFVAEFRDSHFNSLVNTNHVSLLGFVADRVEGKALIDEIDRRILPEGTFPFERGDEILSIGRKNVADIVEELGSYLGSGYRQTNLRSATMLLGFRPSSRVPPQYGTTMVSIRHGTSSIIDTVELAWVQKGDLVDEMATNHAPVRSSARPLYRAMDYLDLSNRDFFEGFPKSEKSFRCSGRTRIEIPRNAVMLIEEPFVAYYHPTPKGNVGYLRIPHYYWKPPMAAADESELRFKQYEWVVYQLEKNTVGLIIDQDHNCGGSVDFLEKMVGLFAERPYLGLGFQFLATRNEYLTFKTWLNSEILHTVEGMQFAKVLDLMKSSWAKGERMTPLTTFEASALLDPNPIHYTKPIVMTIDELSGSGGDAFPGMMQGIGRAKLLGTRTMGAGGHVQNMAALAYSGNQLRMTKSLFFRPDGTPVENNGVIPDYLYTTTRDDFLYGYRNYQQTYLKQLSEMVITP